MKYTVIIDSCFIIATIDESDAFHEDATYIFRILLKKSSNVRIIVPPIALYEVISTLIRKGLNFRKVEGAVMRLLHIENIVMLSITEMSAFKHAKKVLTSGSSANSLRTADFLIICIGIDLDALILTFDKKALSKIKPAYSRIYYCSSVGKNSIDDTADFLHEIGLIP